MKVYAMDGVAFESARTDKQIEAPQNRASHSMDGKSSMGS